MSQSGGAMTLPSAGSIVFGRASAGETAVDVSLGPLIGSHAEAGVVDSVAPVPIPILALSHRESAFEVFVEGLPVSPPITSSSSRQSISTHLTFENALVRAYVFGDRVSVGAGETLYNQSSSYTIPSYVAGTGITSSRVAGGRYELAGLPLANESFRFALDVVPVLTGTVSYEMRNVHERPQFERGSQSEFNASYRKEREHTQFECGIRYVNDVAHFQRGGSLADCNTGFRPYASFGAHVGRVR